jgi:hypothetical protein
MGTNTTDTPAAQKQARHLDELLDKALADSFPASDPVSSLATDDPAPADMNITCSVQRNSPSRRE